MWDKRYSGDDFIYGTVANDFLREHAELLRVGDTLCLAEGEGRNAVYLASLGHTVTAVDSSAVGLRKAQTLAEANGQSLCIEAVDLADYDLGEKRWDNIISIFAHVPVPIRQKVHAQMARALKPGGTLLLEAYTPAQLNNGTGGPPVAELTMSLELLREEITGLQFGHALETTRDVVEGTGHTGKGAVVQLVATKA